MTQLLFLFVYLVFRRLWVIGGSNAPQRSKVEVFAKNLDDVDSSWIKMPDLPDKRMWPGCVVTSVGEQQGILVVGGYYNGVSSMFLPLQDSRGHSLETFGHNRNMPRWEYVGGLTKVHFITVKREKVFFQERKWGFAFGYIGSSLAAAGGGDYGDETVDVLEHGSWRRSRVKMMVKREFSAGVTVPSHWFPECQF